jgi:hypothetical protein
MNQAKLQLSADEMNLATNKDVILTKHQVVKKVCELMGALSVQMQGHLTDNNFFRAPEIISSSPKISRGEQYRQMPYVVLDYPRIFSKQHVFAIRTFFWWGHYFSSTLHLKGKYQKQYEQAISAAIGKGWLNNYLMATNGDEFSFDETQGQYEKIKDSHPASVTEKFEQQFVKISHSYAITEWDNLPAILFGDFTKYLACCVAT